MKLNEPVSWLTQLLGIPITSANFLTTLRDGTVLCTVANKINGAALRFKAQYPNTEVKLPSRSESHFS